MGKWDNGGPDRFTCRTVLPLSTECVRMARWLRQRDDRSDPAQCNFRVGNAGRNILTGPGLRWAQVSAQKNFRFSERWNAQLRWDFQNALKTYNFTGPTHSRGFPESKEFRQAAGRSAHRIAWADNR